MTEHFHIFAPYVSRSLIKIRTLVGQLGNFDRFARHLRIPPQPHRPPLIFRVTSKSSMLRFSAVKQRALEVLGTTRATRETKLCFADLQARGIRGG